MVEVVEHLDPSRLAAFERVLFEFTRPRLVVLATPNVEYNVRFASLEEVARERFGVIGEGIGICYTRTGRCFFNDLSLERELLERVRAAIDGSGLWEELRTNWMVLDCELMPWSAKAQKLVRQQYAAVGAAACAALSEAEMALAAHSPSSSGAAVGWLNRQSSAEGASTCGSSMALSTPCPRTYRVCASVVWAENARWPCASSRWASKRWNALSGESRSIACTSAPLGSWRSRASR